MSSLGTSKCFYLRANFTKEVFLSDPAAFIAVHSYCPVSDHELTWIFNVLLVTLNCLVLGKGDPDLVQVISGGGFPVALQSIVTVVPIKVDRLSPTVSLKF